MLFHNISVLILILIYSSCFSQTTEQLKENLLLKREISILDFNASIDSVKTKKWELNDVLNSYINWLYKNKESLLSDENSFFRVHVLLELASAKYAEGEHDEACQYIDLIFQQFNEFLFQDAYIKINKYGASIADGKTNLKKAIDYYEKILEVEKIKSDSVLLADVYLKLSNYYLSNDQYDKSMYYGYKAYPILVSLDNKPELIKLFVTFYNGAQLSSNDTNNTDYLYKALDMALDYNDSLLISSTYSNLGMDFYRNGKKSEAIKYYIIARNFANDKGSKREVRIAVSQHLCYTYMPDSVERACETSDYILKRCLINNDLQLLSNAFLSRANCFANHGEQDSAKHYLDLAEKNRMQFGNPKASAGFFNKMHEVSKKIKDYERALKYLDIAHGENVRINKETNSSLLNNTRAQLDYQIQKDQISELSLKNQIQKEKNKKQKILIISILLVLILSIAFIIFANRKYKELKSSYREVFRKNIELDKLNLKLSQTEEKLLTDKNGNGNGIKDEEKIYKKLKELLEKEKIYKQPDISANKLAKKLNTNTSYLSVIIHNRFDESLKTIINKYRINEARRLLTSPEYSKYSIEGIAEEVGYHSRSTFYQSFKQITGLTPTQYLENYNSK
jgi:YesN/AraC family two-component response regulator